MSAYIVSTNGSRRDGSASALVSKNFVAIDRIRSAFLLLHLVYEIGGTY